MDDRSFVVFGTGGLARELTAWLRSSGCTVIGYVTTQPEQHARYALPGKVLDGNKPLDASALVAIGDPLVRRAVFEGASEKGWVFGTFVHDSAVVGTGVALGRGSIVAPNCTLSVDIKVGLSGFLNFGCGIGHDVTIGDFVQINPGAQIGGNCTIESNTIIGSGATVIESTRIGQGCLIGSGSVLYGRVRDGTRMIAALARRWPQ